MKRVIQTVALLFLAGCGTPEPATQRQSQVQKQPSVTLSPERSTDTTEQSAAEVPAELTASVIRVIDGDTVDVLTDDKQTFRVRLNGIDCPERGQPFVSTSIGGQAMRIVATW